MPTEIRGYIPGSGTTSREIVYEVGRRQRSKRPDWLYSLTGQLVTQGAPEELFIVVMCCFLKRKISDKIFPVAMSRLPTSPWNVESDRKR
jgi:hypothetical protein